MECFRLLLEHFAWIEHQFLSGIRDSRKAGNLWGMMRGVGEVWKSWLAKGLGLGLLCWGFKGVQEEIPKKKPALFKSGQWHFHHDNTPVHNSILVTGYLTNMGIKTVLQLPYSPDLAPCDFWRSIKVPIWKKYGNLFNDPRTYTIYMIYKHFGDNTIHLFVHS